MINEIATTDVLGVRVLTLMGGMLDSEDDDFFGFVVGGVIDEVPVAPRHELAHALDVLLPPNMRKHNKALEGFKDGGANAKRGRRISFTDRRRWRQGLVQLAA
jgi:hypothetical protein